MRNIYISLLLCDESNVMKLVHVISLTTCVDYVTSSYVGCTQHSTHTRAARNLVDHQSDLDSARQSSESSNNPFNSSTYSKRSEKLHKK